MGIRGKVGLKKDEGVMDFDVDVENDGLEDRMRVVFDTGMG